MTALILAAALTHGPPSPPPADSHGVIPSGEVVRLSTGRLRTIDSAGALYLEYPAWQYLLDERNWCRAQVAAATKLAETEAPVTWRPILWAGGLGLVAGALTALLVGSQ